MSVSVSSRRNRLRSSLAAVLTVLVLLPTAALFLRVLSDNSEQRDETLLQQQGVEYLTALSPLVSALAESQASSLQGVKEVPQSVTAATARVTEVDARLGDVLGTTQRWTGLKDKIGRLPSVTGDAATIYQAHQEVTDLTLELFTALRQRSQLNQVSQNDLWYLQEAATVNLPEAVTWASRMSDLANMAANAKKAQKPALNIAGATAVQNVESAVNALTENLQAAAADTESATLSGSLVSNLDSFRRGIEAANRGVSVAGVPNAAALATAQVTLQKALDALSNVVYGEMKNLYDDRLDSDDYRRIEAWGLFVLALALMAAGIYWGRGRGAAPATTTGETGREVSVQSDAGNGSTYGGNSPNPYDQPNYGEASGYGDVNRRERSSALR